MSRLGENGEGKGSESQVVDTVKGRRVGAADLSIVDSFRSGPREQSCRAGAAGSRRRPSLYGPYGLDASGASHPVLVRSGGSRWMQDE